LVIVDTRKDVKIEFTGLKEGLHEYRFEIGEAFFDSFEGSIVESGEVVVNLEFEKGSNLFTITYSVSGKVTTTCSLCGGEMEEEIQGDAKFFVKFGEESMSQTDDIIVVMPHEHQIDVSHPIYETISLALPLSPKHENEEDCDQDVIDRLDNYLVDKEEEEGDSIWDDLKDLKL